MFAYDAQVQRTNLKELESLHVGVLMHGDRFTICRERETRLFDVYDNWNSHEHVGKLLTAEQVIGLLRDHIRAYEQRCVWQLILAHLWKLTLAHLWQLSGSDSWLEKRWNAG
jgi:hypothetical protein